MHNNIKNKYSKMERYRIYISYRARIEYIQIQIQFSCPAYTGVADALYILRSHAQSQVLLQETAPLLPLAQNKGLSVDWDKGVHAQLR